MSSASSVLPSDLVSVEVAALQVGAHPQTSLTRCTFPVLYPVLAPERGFGSGNPVSGVEIQCRVIILARKDLPTPDYAKR